MKRAMLAIIGLLAVLLPVTASSATAGAETTSDGVPTYRVQVRNISSGQYSTPPNFAIHNGRSAVFKRGEPASPGVQAVAENGAVPVLAAELQASLDDTGLGVSTVGSGGVEGPIGPGDSREFTITGEGRRFSLVSMIVCTNDGFSGINGAFLPTGKDNSKVFFARSFDAGTEINTEMRADLVPAPFCGAGDGTGESNPALAEDGVIRRHRTLQNTGDLDPSLDWRGAVMQVVITRMEPVPTYTVTIENTTSGQYLTPPNFAVHKRGAHIFRVGRAASPGVQAVAENGAVPVLAAELTNTLDNTGLGTSTVGSGGVEGPIAPGDSREFTISGHGPQWSLVSMIVCTNDGFAGADGRNLPNRVGSERSFTLRSFDAGTEVNTELRADLVPAPFCGDGAGSTESNPALAEDFVITPHRTLRNIGDLDRSLDFPRRVAQVTITRNS